MLKDPESHTRQPNGNIACYKHVAAAAAKSLQSCPTLRAMQETWVQSLGREDPLKKEMATLSSILAWRIPWTEKLSPQGRKELDTTK